MPYRIGCKTEKGDPLRVCHGTQAKHALLLTLLMVLTPLSGCFAEPEEVEIEPKLEILTETDGLSAPRGNISVSMYPSRQNLLFKDLLEPFLWMNLAS